MRDWSVLFCLAFSLTDPDLQKRGGGRGGRTSRPRRGVEWSAKTIFLPFGPQLGLKIRGAALGPLLWIRHCLITWGEVFRWRIRDSLPVIYRQQIFRVAEGRASKFRYCTPVRLVSKGVGKGGNNFLPKKNGRAYQRRGGGLNRWLTVF